MKGIMIKITEIKTEYKVNALGVDGSPLIKWRYEGGEQSHEKFNNYNLWRDGFYRQLITNVHKGLRTGGVFCLQVGSQKYPLLEDGKRIAQDVGFSIEDVRGAGMDNSNGVSDAEKKECILILRKV